MRMVAFTIGLVGVAQFCVAADNKPATKEQKAIEAAIAKYDDLPDEYRRKAVAYWQESYERLNEVPKKKETPADKARRLEKLEARIANDPPYYPSIFRVKQGSDKELPPDTWGALQMASKTGKGCYVLQVVSKTRFLSKIGDVYFFVDGVDTTKMVDERTYEIPGLFYVSGADTYETVAGASRKVPVVSPVPKRDVSLLKKADK